MLRDTTHFRIIAEKKSIRWKASRKHRKFISLIRHTEKPSLNVLILAPIMQRFNTRILSLPSANRSILASILFPRDAAPSSNFELFRCLGVFSSFTFLDNFLIYELQKNIIYNIFLALIMSII